MRRLRLLAQVKMMHTVDTRHPSCVAIIGGAPAERILSVPRPISYQIREYITNLPLRSVCEPLVSENPAVAVAIAEGALMRLECGARCFERYRSELGLP